MVKLRSNKISLEISDQFLFIKGQPHMDFFLGGGGSRTYICTACMFLCFSGHYGNFDFS